jgi:hypothetical protein
MIYANIVSTIALGAAIGSLIWQVYTWLHRKKREETPMLRVFILREETHDHFGKIQSNFYFVIQNVGSCGITVLDCKINDFPIYQSEAFENAKTNIIGAKIEPKNSVRCMWIWELDHRIGLGANVKLSYKSDSGKTFEKDYTLSEGQE